MGSEREMLVIREETPRDVGQVRMINIAAFEQPDDAFMVRILDAGGCHLRPHASLMSSWATPTRHQPAGALIGITRVILKQ